jgi:DNA-binding ferritin-like protein
MSPSLSVVAGNEAGAVRNKADTVAERVRALQAEAKGLAREHVLELEHLLLQVEKMSAEIAEGGDAYPAGVRDIARRLAEECEAKVQTLEAIVSRA